MKRTQIVLVTPSLAVGGAETLVSQLAVALTSLSISPTVIVVGGRTDSANESALEGRVDVQYLDALGMGHLGRARAVWRALSQLRPTVLHTHLFACLYVAPWAMMHRARWIHTLHSEPSKEVPPRVRALMAACYVLGRAVPVCISEGLANRTAAYYHLARSGVRVVYNGVRLVSRPAEAVRELDLPVIVSVGRLNPNKNQTLAIRALAELRRRGVSARLVLVGDGESRDVLGEEARSLGVGDGVLFRGAIPDVWPDLWRASCFVLTSQYEGLPLAVLEALGAGLPVISTDVGAVSEVLGESGMLVPPGDLLALVDGLERILRDVPLRTSMAEEALRESKRFAISAVAENYVKVYRDER